MVETAKYFWNLRKEVEEDDNKSTWARATRTDASTEKKWQTVVCCIYVMTLVWFLGYSQNHGIQVST